MIKHGKVEFERRVFPRFHMNLPIVYQRDLQSPPVTARTGNVSRGGLLLYLEERLPIGERIHIKLRLTDPKAPRLLEALGTIMWVSSERTEDGHYQAGFAFSEIAEEHLEVLREFESLWLEQGA